jgi:hypothetical protein
MEINSAPKPLPYHIYVQCVDDTKPRLKEPIVDWISNGATYVVYGLSKIFNTTGEEQSEYSYHIMDLEGNKLMPNINVPTYRADRFEMRFMVHLN